MRDKKVLMRLLALLFAFALAAAACGSDDDSGDDGGDDGGGGGGDDAAAAVCPTGEEPLPEADPAPEAPSQTVEKSENVGGDGVLDFGTILPETGDLAFLGPPEFAGVDLAVQDINEAGGVNDANVTVSHGDSGDTSTDLASTESARLIAAGVDAIIGAASSGVSLNVIDQITGAGVIQFSPANTSPTFTDYDDGGLYFRTAPSDVLQGRVLADLVAADGFTTAAVLARDDDYGVNLKDSFEGYFTDAGGTVAVSEAYDPQAQNFDAEVDAVVGAEPDAIIIIGFDETAQIITGLQEAGFGPQDVQTYGTDGNMGNALAEGFDDATVLTCMKGTVPQTELGSDFTDRLLGLNPDLVDFSYAAESYDAVVITALAAQIAGSDDSAAIAAEINDVTREGETCTTFAECKELLDGGTTDIDYDGVGGPYEFIDAGEPGAAVFAIPQFDETGTVQIPDYQEAEL